MLSLHKTKVLFRLTNPCGVSFVFVLFFNKEKNMQENVFSPHILYGRLISAKNIGLLEMEKNSQAYNLFSLHGYRYYQGCQTIFFKGHISIRLNM